MRGNPIPRHNPANLTSLPGPTPSQRIVRDTSFPLPALHLRPEHRTVFLNGVETPLAPLIQSPSSLREILVNPHYPSATYHGPTDWQKLAAEKLELLNTTVAAIARHSTWVRDAILQFLQTGTLNTAAGHPKGKYRISRCRVLLWAAMEHGASRLVQAVQAEMVREFEQEEWRRVGVRLLDDDSDDEDGNGDGDGDGDGDDDHENGAGGSTRVLRSATRGANAWGEQPQSQTLEPGPDEDIDGDSDDELEDLLEDAADAAAAAASPRKKENGKKQTAKHGKHRGDDKVAETSKRRRRSADDDEDEGAADPPKKPRFEIHPNHRWRFGRNGIVL